MAYASEDMRLMGGVPGQQLFLYRTEDPLETVATDDYFAPAREDYNLGTGDFIVATMGPGMASVARLFVTRDNEGVLATVSAE
ncbi:hypothetical protein [Pseudodesulfovibrio tunisiensis]|uniref:hypothetical protein n=1 Tax=Pseudodesulfovibrio tunisiensis TaxID=463192 RepID=UPI001FB36783|nr:hypothetical protein [Pseudodesulfovibrio tunisiensis]